MADQNCKNYFEQPIDAAHQDNILVLGGTVKGADGNQAPAVANAAGTDAALIDSIRDALINVGIISA